MSEIEFKPHGIPLYQIKLDRLRTFTNEDKKRFTKPINLAKFLRNNVFLDLDREIFVVLTLNSQHNIIGINIAHVGTLNASPADVRDVFKLAILQNAKTILVAHNHPSDSVEPSPGDFELTRRLIKAGKILDIHVDDHIIISTGNSDYYSFSENVPELFSSNL